MRSVRINLIQAKITQNNIGVSVKEETKKTVYAEISTSGQREFFKAAQSGFKPALQALVWDFEYSGEREAEIDGVRYSIYRTYDKSESGMTELYLERRGGNGGN